jgi:quercetin dioxygenase-like cupin family protein
MKINDNLTEQANEHYAHLQWVASPMKGVERKMLERNGTEMAAKVTSIVRYEQGSKFSSHIHSGGEEFLVLDGVFQDQHGDYPAGTYVRNPPGTEHTPRADPGCMIIVKLGQYQAGDNRAFSVDTKQMQYREVAHRKHVESIALHQFANEQVAMERWGRNGEITLENNGGIELLVTQGSFSHQGQVFGQYDWLRLPHGTNLQVQTGVEGCQVWIKTGHHTYQMA